MSWGDALDVCTGGILRVLLIVGSDWIQACEHLHCSGPTVQGTHSA